MVADAPFSCLTHQANGQILFEASETTDIEDFIQVAPSTDYTDPFGGQTHEQNNQNINNNWNSQNDHSNNHNAQNEEQLRQMQENKCLLLECTFLYMLFF